MKKSTKIIIAVAVVLIIVIAVVFGISLNLNKTKEAMSSYLYKATMEEKGFNVIDANSALSSSITQVKQAYLAIDNSYSYQIEFYELIDEEAAISFYNNNKKSFEESKGNASADTNVEMKNHAKYTLSSNGKYMVVSRIDNTVIYISVPDAYRDVVKDILKEIGY